MSSGCPVELAENCGREETESEAYWNSVKTFRNTLVGTVSWEAENWGGMINPDPLLSWVGAADHPTSSKARDTRVSRLLVGLSDVRPIAHSSIIPHSGVDSQKRIDLPCPGESVHGRGDPAPHGSCECRKPSHWSDHAKFVRPVLGGQVRLGWTG